MVLSFSLGYPNFLVLYVSFNTLVLQMIVFYYVSFSFKYFKLLVLLVGILSFYFCMLVLVFVLQITVVLILGI